jgi:hypothetical protein
MYVSAAGSSRAGSRALGVWLRFWPPRPLRPWRLLVRPPWTALSPGRQLSPPATTPRAQTSAHLRPRMGRAYVPHGPPRLRRLWPPNLPRSACTPWLLPPLDGRLPLPLLRRTVLIRGTGGRFPHRPSGQCSYNWCLLSGARIAASIFAPFSSSSSHDSMRK